MKIIITLAFWQLIASMLVLFLYILAIRRHKKKKIKPWSNLVLAFTGFWLASIFQIIGTFFNIYNIGTASINFKNSYWIVIFILKLINEYQISYFCVMIGTYFFYKFAQYIFQEEINKAGENIALGSLIIIILFGIIRFPWERINISMGTELIFKIDLYVAIFEFLILIPILKHSAKLYKHILKDVPLQNNIKYLAITTTLFIIMMLTYIFETIWGVMTGNPVNIFSFIASIFVILSLCSAYRGFYGKYKKS